MPETTEQVNVPPIPPRPTIGELFARLAANLLAFIKAEIIVYRADTTQKLVSAAWIIGLVVIAVSLAQGALIALLIGLVLALAEPVGIWWALAIVVLGAVIIAGLLIKIASIQGAKLTRGAKKS